MISSIISKSIGFVPARNWAATVDFGLVVFGYIDKSNSLDGTKFLSHGYLPREPSISPVHDNPLDT